MKQGKWVSLLMTLVMTISLTSYGAPLVQTTLPPETSASVKTGWPVEGNYSATMQVYDENDMLYAETFEEVPERVVCNQPQATQLPLVLRLGDRIVGACRSVRDANGEYRDEFGALPSITDNDGPSEEVVLDVEPDPIVGWGSTFTEDTLGSMQDWNEWGTAAYIMDNSAPGVEGRRTVSCLYNDVEKLGEIFGIEGRVQAMISDMKTQKQAITDKVFTLEDTDKTTAFAVQMAYENEFFGRKDTDFAYDLIEKVGGIYLDKAFGKQSIEGLIALNPDVLVIINRTDSSAREKIDALKNNPSLSGVNAVKSDRFVSLDHVSFYGGSYGTIGAVESLVCGFYPELFSR